MPSQPTLPLVDKIIPGGLEKYLYEAREQGQSYQAIRDRLIAEHDITVSQPTVISWCRQYELTGKGEAS